MNEKVKIWLTKAREDLKVADHEMRLPDGEVVTSAVCFHCQQFVEKMLKAFLASKGVDFPRTHNLELLLKLCGEKDPDFKDLTVGDLTYYAVEIRYPDEFSVPPMEEAKECFEIAKKVGRFVFGKLGLPEKDNR